MREKGKKDMKEIQKSIRRLSVSNRFISVYSGKVSDSYLDIRRAVWGLHNTLIDSKLKKSHTFAIKRSFLNVPLHSFKKKKKEKKKKKYMEKQAGIRCSS